MAIRGRGLGSDDTLKEVEKKTGLAENEAVDVAIQQTDEPMKFDLQIAVNKEPISQV